MGKVGWSDLHEELVDLIADRVSSHIDLLRCRSICKPWRSAVANKKRFPYRFERNLPSFKSKNTFLSPTSFFRVTIPSSCPNKGWLIKTRQVSESGKSNFLSPLCGKLITTSDQTLDLLKLGVSEIRQSYNVRISYEWTKRRQRRPAGAIRISYECFVRRVVLVDNMLFAVCEDKEIWYCKIGEESSEWRSIIRSEEAKCFSDIIVQKDLIYALDSKGAMWWISIPELKIFQYRPSTPVDDDYYGDDYCKDKRLVEYCGDLCVVHRLCKKLCVKGAVIERTVGFKVYKMDANLVEWVNVTSLGDKALIVSVDSCFTVSASEYYGCLKNAIYYTDKVKGEDIVHVFKLDDSSIISMNESSSHSCFELFTHPFL